MKVLRLRAPAKINWTLEVLDKREDGYHTIRSIMQTIDLSDSFEFEPADELTLLVKGDRFLPDVPLQENFAYRAAERLHERTGVRAGAHITLTKGIPIAAGLGGGSSDAAAVLRGLRVLWELDISDEELTAIAAELGSDAPFFLRGGTALASGRGERIEPLPDALARRISIASPTPRVVIDKTASMYAALRPEHYTNGARTEALAARLRGGEPIRDKDLYNAFESVLPEVDPAAAELFARAAALGLGTPHLCGSGPAFFFLLAEGRAAGPALERLRDLGLRAVETTTLSSAEAAPREERL